jgi:hypothetical protein
LINGCFFGAAYNRILKFDEKNKNYSGTGFALFLNEGINQETKIKLKVISW